MVRLLLLAGTALLLAACGAREPLKPPQGASLPVKPYSAQATPTAEALVEPPPQTRPERSDTLIESSKERRSDEFDLPPPD
ncbi:hypothetical protein [Sphingomonas sp.]|uniref:hypothetical protein n=1 Tax=Sphingomonas sp. TaxID=28214 RepID=UPI001B10822F|nr:hypothetical protein [Sphingomonas sp.]MBO9713949.1 hypothetical protein [Sphingomonas sp.]